jgi:hypothetical protein
LRETGPSDLPTLAELNEPGFADYLLQRFPDRVLRPERRDYEAAAALRGLSLSDWLAGGDHEKLNQAAGVQLVARLYREQKSQQT